jgi:peptidoglycan hydrolase-like protein with peptidoglycan-binding domain
MSKLHGTSLALAGIWVGIYTALSGANIGGSPPKVSADTSVHMPTPSGRTPVEDAAAGVIPPTVVEIADGAPRVAYLPSSASPLDRVRLTRTIQAQLRRVGCYHGAVDGVWSASVRRSMKSFTERVNGTLPVEQPDIILLAMLQSHRDGGCAVPCPPGHGLAADGRCLPSRLIASAEKQAPAGSPDTATASPSISDTLAVGQPPSKEERMSLAGPALPPAMSDAPAKAGRRHASPPANASPSGRFPHWAARAFESW